MSLRWDWAGSEDRREDMARGASTREAPTWLWRLCLPEWEFGGEWHQLAASLTERENALVRPRPVLPRDLGWQGCGLRWFQAPGNNVWRGLLTFWRFFPPPRLAMPLQEQCEDYEHRRWFKKAGFTFANSDATLPSVHVCSRSITLFLPIQTYSSRTWQEMADYASLVITVVLAGSWSEAGCSECKARLHDESGPRPPQRMAHHQWTYQHDVPEGARQDEVSTTHCGKTGSRNSTSGNVCILLSKFYIFPWHTI